MRMEFVPLPVAYRDRCMVCDNVILRGCTVYVSAQFALCGPCYLKMNIEEDDRGE